MRAGAPAAQDSRTETPLPLLSEPPSTQPTAPAVPLSLPSQAMATVATSRAFHPRLSDHTGVSLRSCPPSPPPPPLHHHQTEVGFDLLPTYPMSPRWSPNLFKTQRLRLKLALSSGLVRLLVCPCISRQISEIYPHGQALCCQESRMTLRRSWPWIHLCQLPLVPPLKLRLSGRLGHARL